MSIFKAFDIRGKYPDQINEETAYKIGRAFVVFTKTKEVMVGRDARVHSLSLAQALIRGITDQGADVVDIGMSTTPQTIAMYTWMRHETAIMVTASHLDAPFNGFKMYTQGGRNITYRYGMKELQELVTNNNFNSSCQGSVRIADYTSAYAQGIAKLKPVKSLLRFVVDCSNGSVGPEVLLHRKNLELNLKIVNCAPDGNFPNHSPNPILSSAHAQIKEEILKESAAGGCIFDADADRIVFFNEKGEYIHPNYISCMIIREILRQNPNRVIAYDLISSRVVPETISALRGIPLRTQVGRNVLTDDMREHNALFGAESSSHMIYQEVAYADASTLSMLHVLDILTQSRMPFSSLVNEYSRYALLHETNYVVPNPDEILHAIESEFPDARKDYLDGITLEFPDGWIVARKSNTEPLLRIRAEGDDPSVLERLFGKAQSVILSRGGKLEAH